MPGCIDLILQFAVVGPLCAWMMSGYLHQDSSGHDENVPGVEASAPSVPTPPSPEMLAWEKEHRCSRVKQNSIGIIGSYEQTILREDRNLYR